MGRRRLVALAFALAVLLGLAGRLFAGNPNSGLLTLAGALCAGGALLAGIHQLGPRFGAPGLREGRSLLIVAGSLATLAVPWQIEIPPAHLSRLFGWQTPLAWVFAAALIAGSLFARWRWQGPGLALAGLALAAWGAWLGHLLLTREFSRLGFPFQVVDLLAVGWYVAVATFLLAAEGEAARRGEDDAALPGLPELLTWALLPGLGLVRLGRRSAGLGLLGAAGVVGFLLWLSAYGQDQFLYWSTFSYTPLLPPPRLRNDVTALLGVLILLVLASLAWTVLTMKEERQPRRQLSSWAGLGQAAEPEGPPAGPGADRPDGSAPRPSAEPPGA